MALQQIGNRLAFAGNRLKGDGLVRISGYAAVAGTALLSTASLGEREFGWLGVSLWVVSLVCFAAALTTHWKAFPKLTVHRCGPTSDEALRVLRVENPGEETEFSGSLTWFSHNGKGFDVRPIVWTEGMGMGRRPKGQSVLIGRSGIAEAPILRIERRNDKPAQIFTYSGYGKRWREAPMARNWRSDGVWIRITIETDPRIGNRAIEKWLRVTAAGVEAVSRPRWHRQADEKWVDRLKVSRRM